MKHSKLLNRIQSIASVYNLAEHPSQELQPDYRQIARTMRDLANELFSELVDDEKRAILTKKWFLEHKDIIERNLEL